MQISADLPAQRLSSQYRHFASIAHRFNASNFSSNAVFAGFEGSGSMGLRLYLEALNRTSVSVTDDQLKASQKVNVPASIMGHRRGRPQAPCQEPEPSDVSNDQSS
jgi:hypothetical protein